MNWPECKEQNCTASRTRSGKRNEDTRKCLRGSAVCLHENPTFDSFSHPLLRPSPHVLGCRVLLRSFTSHASKCLTRKCLRESYCRPKWGQNEEECVLNWPSFFRFSTRVHVRARMCGCFVLSPCFTLNDFLFELVARLWSRVVLLLSPSPSPRSALRGSAAIQFRRAPHGILLKFLPNNQLNQKHTGSLSAAGSVSVCRGAPR